MKEIKSEIYASLKKLEHWIEHHHYKGYDPADGLTSYLRPLTFGNLFLDRVLLQLVQRSPVNLRPYLGIKPLDSYIGRGYMAWGYLTMLKISGDENYKLKAGNCLEWLKNHKAPGYEQHCWGKLFDFASRGGLYTAQEPILIWTALIGNAFIDAYEILNDHKYLKVADSICTWILNLPRNRTNTGWCLGYHGNEENCTIHNSNMAGAAVLARTAKHTQNLEYLSVAKEAMKYSCSRQLPDGAWLYGEVRKYHWIDNFHTGYNLDALKHYIEYTGDTKYKNNLKIGFKFFKDNFFEKSGKPKYYHNKTYPVDSQCTAQAIESLANFTNYDESALELAIRVAKWVIDNMQDKFGYFYFRQYPFMTLKVPMIHWAQATTYRAFTLLLSKL